MKRFVICVFAFMAALAAQAEACEGLRLDVRQEAVRDYDPSALGRERLTITLQLAEAPSSPSDCARVQISITPAHGAGPALQLRKASELLTLNREHSQNLIPSGAGYVLAGESRARLLAGEAVEASLGEIVAGQYVSPGLYNADLAISSGNSIHPLNVQVMVNPSLRFVESGSGDRTLDLGDPSQAPGQDSRDFMFRTNTGVRFSVRSHNRGEMVHESGRGHGMIAYRASLRTEASAERVLDLSVVDEAHHVDFRPSAAVRVGTLRVEVPRTPGLHSGRYHDTITISLLPRY